MSTSTAHQTTMAARTPPVRLTLRMLVAGIVWLLVMQVAVERSVMPPIGIIQALVLAVPAIMIARRVRGGLVTATVITGLILLAGVPHLISDLSHPREVITFVWNVVALPLFVALPFVALRAARSQPPAAA